MPHTPNKKKIQQYLQAKASGLWFCNVSLQILWVRSGCMGLLELSAINLVSDDHVFLYTCLMPTWRPGFMSSKFVLTYDYRANWIEYKITSNIIFIIAYTTTHGRVFPQILQDTHNYSVFIAEKSRFREGKWFVQSYKCASVFHHDIALSQKKKPSVVKVEGRVSGYFSTLLIDTVYAVNRDM